MPPIPTIQSNASLLGRTARQPEADASSFGAASGDALQRLGAVGMQVTAQAHQIAETRKNLESDKWANDAMSELRQFYGPWLANNENNSKETFADDFRNLTDQSLKDWEAKAPTKEARIKFRDQFQRYRDSRLESASVTAAKTQMDNMLMSHEALNGSIIQGYMSDRATPNVDANKELMANIADRFTSIDQSLGKLAPAKAAQLKGQLIEDATYTTMNYSTTTARKILELGTGFLDGRRIHAIESQIKVAEDSAKALDLATLNTMVENRINAAKLGRQPAKFDLGDIQLYLPDDKAIALRDKVNAEIDTYNLANQHVTDISSWNGPEQLKFVEELRDKAGKDESTATRDADVLRFVEQRVDANVRWFQRDPAGYMIANNPAIKGIDDQIKSLSKVQGNEELIKQKFAERDSLMKKLQLPPSKETTDAEKKQHNIVNRSQLKVMSDTEAQQVVAAINESSPQEVIDVILGELSKHPGNEAIAFNNLVQLQNGKGLRGDYWLVYKNIENSEVGDLIGAIQHSQESIKNSPDAVKDFDDALDGYAPWKGYSRIFSSDNNQREGMLGGIRSAIVSYAAVTARRNNISPDLAIKKAVDTFLFKEQGIGVVNGQPVLFDRNIPGQPPRDDQEIANFSRRLSELPKLLDPRSISTTDRFGRDHFPSLRSAGNDEAKLVGLQSIIQNFGFFQPSADGKSSTFYLRSENGTPFEARTPDNHAIQVNNEDVPTFLQSVEFRGEFGELITSVDTFVPITTKPLFEKKQKVEVVPFAPDKPEFRSYRGYTKNLITDYTQTNWPVEPKWFKRLDRSK